MVTAVAGFEQRYGRWPTQKDFRTDNGLPWLRDVVAAIRGVSPPRLTSFAPETSRKNQEASFIDRSDAPEWLGQPSEICRRSFGVWRTGLPCRATLE